MRKYITILLIAAVAYVTNVNAQINNDSINAICRKIIDPNGPAVAVLIMKDGEVAYKKTFGYENIETKSKATNFTQFNIASISKSFAAAAIMQLVERGKVSLTDTIGKYLKGYAIGSRITIHQLLSNTSGLSDTSGTYYSEKSTGVKFVRFDDSVSMKGVDKVRNLYLQYVLNGYNAKYPPSFNYTMIDTFLAFAPGSQYKYSNTGYSILAKIVAKVSGLPYNIYLRKNIFLPAGMKNSFSYNTWNDVDIAHPANTHMWMNDGSYRKMFERVPDGEGSTNVYTTIDDWIQYEKLLAGKAPSVLSKESLNKMFTPHITSNIRRNIKWMYGYGWMIVDRYSEKDTMRCIQHSGGTLGSSSYRINYRDQNLTLTVFYAEMHEDFTKYRWIDVVNGIEGYLKRKKLIPDL